MHSSSLLQCYCNYILTNSTACHLYLLQTGSYNSMPPKGSSKRIPHPTGGVCCLCKQAEGESGYLDARFRWREPSADVRARFRVHGKPPHLAHYACRTDRERQLKQAAAAASNSVSESAQASLPSEPIPHPGASTSQQASAPPPLTGTVSARPPAASIRELLLASQQENLRLTGMNQQLECERDQALQQCAVAQSLSSSLEQQLFDCSVQLEAVRLEQSRARPVMDDCLGICEA